MFFEIRHYNIIVIKIHFCIPPKFKINENR